MHAGQTVLVVAHVVDHDLVLTDEQGSNQKRIPIADVVRVAARHKVLFMPIGCQTAGAGIAVGFKNKINSASVRDFLSKTSLNPTFGALFESMQTIGPLVIDLNPKIEISDSFALSRHSAEDRGIVVEVSTMPTPGRPTVQAQVRISGDMYKPLQTGSLRERWDDLPAPAQIPFFIFSLTLFSMCTKLGVQIVARSRFVLNSRSRSDWLSTLIALEEFLGITTKLGLVFCGCVLVIALLLVNAWLVVGPLLAYSLILNLPRN